jgi:RsiW-degrading membrane proteinase PrsW (M82 family)
MPGADLELWLLSALLGAVWALAVAWRAPAGTLRTAARVLLGGAAAIGLAATAYGLLQAAGYSATWERMLQGGWGAIGLAAAIGVVEEIAKLCGIALAGERPRGPADVLRVTAGVAAAFAIGEGALTLRGVSLPLAALHSALAPVAHALLSAPLGAALAAGATVGGRGWHRLVPGLGISASLHGAADYSLALPHFGGLAYGLTLLLPTLWLFAYTRRLAGWPLPWGPGGSLARLWKAHAPWPWSWTGRRRPG